MSLESIQYQVIRSGRKTLSLELSPKGLLVRAPYAVTQAQIEDFIRSNENWIESHRAKLQKAMEAQNGAEKLTLEELRALADRAAAVIPPRVAYYAEKIGVTYGRITIRNQKTRWGSCSAKGNLNFNCLLMMTPPDVIDYVIVHELCHRLEMNHSPRFWKYVASIMPDYKDKQKWLRENGQVLIDRLE